MSRSSIKAYLASTAAQLLVVIAMAVSLPAAASSGPRGTTNVALADAARIAGFVFDDAHGDVALNVAAGAGNQQSNAITIVTAGARGAMATAGAHTMMASPLAKTDGADAVLAGHAFAGFTGNAAVNIASGAGNVQRNAITILRHAH